MDIAEIGRRGLVLIGCGRMGSALLEGWLARGIAPASVWVQEPAPSGDLVALAGRGLHLNTILPAQPAVVLVAVKPQKMAEVLGALGAMAGPATLVISIAAGTPLATFAAACPPGTPIVRVMPNTPAAVGRGISALIGNAAAGPAHLALAEALMAAVGEVVHLDDEGQMDAVTALSGSGPAYVFHLIEAMAAAGVAAGLPEAMAAQLARATVCGAGELARLAPETPARLRENVTSPGGTTAAALRVLMDPVAGLPPLMVRAVAAAAERGRELGRGA
jgi:pyrroline-5-carboxylate reductase